MTKEIVLSNRKMLTNVKNRTIFKNKYQMHPKAAIVSCFFNSQKSEYRKKAFDIFYESIRHLPYLIVEGVIGDDQTVPDDFLSAEECQVVKNRQGVEEICSIDESEPFS
jgi:hypothetical protein